MAGCRPVSRVDCRLKFDRDDAINRFEQYARELPDVDRDKNRPGELNTRISRHMELWKQTFFDNALNTYQIFGELLSRGITTVRLREIFDRVIS